MSVRPRNRIAVATLLLLGAGAASAAPSLSDYRYFRALSIDLNGRIPTRDELAAFEKASPTPDAVSAFLDGWIDQQLQAPAYAERVRRVYQDLLRLEVGPVFLYRPDVSVLRRETLTGPDGKDLFVFWRYNQRRTRPETDGTFCLDQAETGLQVQAVQPALGTPKPVAQADLDKYTRLVKPWWLYRDYKSPNPSQRYDPASWSQLAPGFVPAKDLLFEPDGVTPTAGIRVCNEEAQTAAMGTVYASGRTMKPPQGTPPPYGRLDFPPLDNYYAQHNPGAPVACHSSVAHPMSADCGCGAGLERCMPGASYALEGPAFNFPSRLPLGQGLPFDQPTQPQSSWMRLWWSEEAVHFLDYVLLQDRDFREVLSGRETLVNGPLTQFYRDLHAGTMAPQAMSFGYLDEQSLVDPAALPADLLPHDAAQWRLVPDRGPRASGLLTMPVFLTKFGTRRARAHVLWQAFACQDFVAGKIQLMPSTEPDLTKRPGCNVCHATLEPLSAYYTRIQENNWIYLPPANFPLEQPTCASADPKKMSYACQVFYDPSFTDSQNSTLRGAYSSTANAEAGPQGFAAYLTSTSRFESCVAQNLASSFLGRALTPDDQVLQQTLARSFAADGFRMRGLVKALVKSDAYRLANNLSSTVIRGGGAN